MVYLIEARRPLNLASLGDVVVDALEALNRDRRTDFKRIPGFVWPRLLDSNEDYDEYAIGRFEHGYDPALKMYRNVDSVLAYELKSMRGPFSEELACHLIQEGIRPSLAVVPGLGDTCPVLEHGDLYVNPTADRKFNSYEVARMMQALIPEIDQIWCCWTRGEAGVELRIVQKDDLPELSVIGG